MKVNIGSESVQELPTTTGTCPSMRFIVMPEVERHDPQQYQEQDLESNRDDNTRYVPGGICLIIAGGADYPSDTTCADDDRRSHRSLGMRNNII